MLRIFSTKTEYGAKERKNIVTIYEFTLNGDSQREIANEGVVQSTNNAIDNKERTRTLSILESRLFAVANLRQHQRWIN